MNGFVPPPYPYDRLARFAPLADRFDGGLIDLSVGTPTDAPPLAVVEALATSGTERGYPQSIGTPALRDSASRWMGRRFGVEVSATDIGAVIGTKEFVGTLPQLLSLRTPDRDTVLYPAISYPTYEMGATLAGCRRGRSVTALDLVSPRASGSVSCEATDSSVNMTVQSPPVRRGGAPRAECRCRAAAPPHNVKENP